MKIKLPSKGIKLPEELVYGVRDAAILTFKISLAITIFCLVVFLYFWIVDFIATFSVVLALLTLLFLGIFLLICGFKILSYWLE